MIRKRGSFLNARFGRMSRTGVVVMLCLFTIIGFAVVCAELAVPRGEVSAAPAASKYEPWLEINCLENVVEEGDDFRLIVNKKFDSDWPHKTIKVWWYTHSITADATDYEHLHQERQASNGSQSRHGRMGRDFHTIEDNYPEIDETFTVEFLNAVSKGHDGECTITITDDDGVGIYDLEITSVPHGNGTAQDGQPKLGYIVGETIEITARFTGDVTAINPGTGERSDYAGIYIQVGENRRFATYLRNYGDDALVFGYKVQADDLDADGISVEGGGPGTGLGYNANQRNGGIWITQTGSSQINRLFHGLDDDPAHPVVQATIEEPPVAPPTDNEEAPLQPPPMSFEHESLDPAITGANGFFSLQHGELTDEDGGRDWFSFPATGGEEYIIEVESRMEILEDGGTPYVDNHLIDPSILEIVNEQGEQVMGEHDRGGFTGLWARGFFTPAEDGTYYIAVGSGAQARGYLGHYTISVRQDDHADDERTQPGVVIHPGQSITACIDSDIGPDEANPHAWAWAETGADDAVPRFGIESADDKDVFRFEIVEAGTYRLDMIDSPDGVGLWAVWYADGWGDYLSYEAPVESFTSDFEAGTHYFAVGTPYQSVGNTGLYTVSLTAVEDGNSSNGG